MSGYVRLHRTLLDHAAFRNDAEAMAFGWMIMRAQWRDKDVRYKGHRISLKRGQLAISQRDMADDLDRDKGWVERLWRRLKSEAMIEADCKAGVAVITICNYDDYQPIKEGGKARAEAPDEADARQAQGTEQIREEVNKEPNGSYRPWACPRGVDPQHWADFRRNRKTRRLTDSPTAYAGQLKALADIADDEWPPGLLVQYAAEKGWGSINDPRKPANDRQPQSGSRTSQALLRAVGGRPDEPF